MEGKEVEALLTRVSLWSTYNNIPQFCTITSLIALHIISFPLKLLTSTEPKNLPKRKKKRDNFTPSVRNHNVNKVHYELCGMQTLLLQLKTDHKPPGN